MVEFRGGIERVFLRRDLEESSKFLYSGQC